MAKLFNSGTVVMTMRVKELADTGKITYEKMTKAFLRHMDGDWGNIALENQIANDTAVVAGNRILSSYTINNIKIWVITEADRSVTTILLPEEY